MQPPMKIVYHLGVHCTDEERLLRCLLKNRAALAEEGIAVPGPARYRTLLRDTAISLKGQPAPVDLQTRLLDEIDVGDGGDGVRRMILAWDNFAGFAQGSVRDRFYPSAGERMRAFRRLFPDAGTEFHLAVRNPATFLPAVIEKQRGRTFAQFMEGVDVDRLRWSDTIAALRRHNPDVPVTVWCDEDTPLIWPEVLEAVSGHSDALHLEETDDLLAAIMSEDGLAELRGFLGEHPSPSVARRRSIVSTYLKEYALPDRIDVTVEMPGWTEETVARLTEAYDRDVTTLRSLEGVRFLAP